MFAHKNIELLCALVAAVNIATGVVLYREEARVGITLQTGARRQAMMTCTAMCLIFGCTALFFLGVDLRNAGRL